MGTYPREYKDMYIHSSTWETNGIPVKEVGYLNFFGVRSIARTIGVYRDMVKWFRRQSGTENYALLYSMITPFMLAGVLAKRRCKGLKLCLYVPDLPGFFIQMGRKGLLYRLLKKIDCALMNHLLKHIDSFALLTEKMNEHVNPERKKPYMVLEGIVSSEDGAEEMEGDLSLDRKSFVYTGLLDSTFGVVDLAEAFMLIEGEAYSLELYGNGEALDRLRAMAEKDSRIHCHGAVPREEALARQREAYILINPRMPDKEFVKYSFPSKTIEYLLSGRPVMMFRLDGVPEEYYGHIITIPSSGRKEMAEAMKKTADLPPEELSERGRRGREFVLREKNEKHQGQKLVELLKRS